MQLGKSQVDFNVTSSISLNLGTAMKIGDVVSVIGKGFPSSTGYTIQFDRLFMYFHNGNVVTSRSRTNGSFYYAFKLPEVPQGGDYKVVATANTGERAEADFTATITSAITEIEPVFGTTETSTTISANGFKSYEKVTVKFEGNLVSPAEFLANKKGELKATFVLGSQPIGAGKIQIYNDSGFQDNIDFTLVSPDWPTVGPPPSTNQGIIRWAKDNSQMALISAGTFKMGDHFNEGSDRERPVHAVALDSFYIDLHEVTVGQFREFVNQSGYNGWLANPNRWNEVAKYSPGDDYPMVYVNGNDAYAYAKWAGKRLPTEAEWEYAARGGLVGKRYTWGDEAELARDHANYKGTGGKDKWDQCAPVGSFQANGYGLYDMAGNVIEFCADLYNEGYYNQRHLYFFYNGVGPHSRIRNIAECHTQKE